MSSERRIPCAIYAPGRRISQLALTVSNRPGALAEIAHAIHEAGVGVLSGLIWAEPGEETATWVFFVDLTGASMEARELAEKLESLNVVLKAEVIKRRFNDLIIDAFSFPTMFLARRMVLLDICSMTAMLDWIDRTFGTGGHAILFDMGREAGKMVVGILKEKYGLAGPKLIEAFLALCTAMGWFRYEVLDMDPQALKARVRLYESYECSPFVCSSERPKSHLLRGVLAGAFEEAFGRSFAVNEVKCVAKGDECCEFEIEPV